MSFLSDTVDNIQKVIDEQGDVVDESQEKDTSSPMEVILKPEILDTSSVEKGEGNTQYRPQTLESFVGQSKAKARLTDYIEGCKTMNETMPHIFLSAPPGHGKSLLSMIIANMLDKKIVQCVGGDLKTEQTFVNKINECDGGVIFIDECNMIKKRVGFFMLPVIEQFIINGIKIKPFTLILATTHRGDLSKDLDALIQRCELDISLEHYIEEELQQIIKQFKNKQYSEIQISKHIYKSISKNCRQTPRLARRLLKNYIFTQDFDKVLQQNQIVKNGLTLTDIKVLQYLLSFEKGASRNTLANILRMKPQTYRYDIEPYLIFKNLIHIDNKTKLTEKGIEFLKETNDI